LLAYLLAVVILVVAAVLAFGLAALLHLHGLAYIIFVTLILLIGIAACVTIIVIHHRKKKEKELGEDPADSAARDELNLLINEANRKLRESQQGAKTLEHLPLIYILGDQGAAKTTLVQQSGLEPELLAGTGTTESDQTPTPILNLWYTRLAALLELGPSIRQSRSLLARLLHRTRATAYRSAFGKGAPPRAAVVCLSADQLLVPGANEALLASARAAGAQLREISRILGMPVPVYVIVTKMDRVPHLEEYVRNLSEDEIRQILGAQIGSLNSSAGTYADQAARTLRDAMDSLIFKLAGFRVELLDREHEPANVPGVYEFPRELGKLRKNLTQYLVELCKPSQLSANPYLRGFYFTGVRARTVERAVVRQEAEVAVAKDAGATQFLNLSVMRARAVAQTATPVITSARVPQWIFLPRLLPEAILGDKDALAPTRQSAPARLFRRILFGSLALVCATLMILVLISYSNNAAIEHRIRDDAHALPTSSAESAAIPSVADLRSLDDLRSTIVQLEGYERDGRPFTYGLGLYQGSKLEERARAIYFDRFRTMFLSPTQGGFLKFLGSLSDSPPANSDTASYLAAYNPLKAYLITTNHPEKSQTTFLTPVFLQYWLASRQADSDQLQLAQRQIDFYGAELLRKPPYSIEPDAYQVQRTQVYLSKFLANTRIYQSMLSDADKKNPQGVDFNRQYPDAVHYVSDSHVVRGAFTKDGFAFMQDALQHPDRYAQGEKWVLGDQSGAGLDVAGLSRDLTALYSSDYLKEWHQFLISAHVAPCGGLKEAPKELQALSGATSPILELFSVISHNTAVADQQIKTVFQPAQVLVDPNASDRLIGVGNNQGYITNLSNLGLSMEGAIAQNPALATDPAAFAQLSPTILNAKAAVQQVSQSFNIDKETHTQELVTALLNQPIDCVARYQPSPGAPAAGAGANICAAINPLLGKFPFSNNQQVQASLAEVDNAFAPDSGALWVNYNGTLKTFLAPAGSQYVQAPNAPQPLSPKFITYFDRAAHISNDLYPNGQKNASLTFNLRFLPGNGVGSATLVVDGQRISSGAGSRFTWNGKTAQSTSLLYDNNEAFAYQGTWSLFQMIRTAQITRSATGYKLDYPINTTIAGHRVGGTSGAAKIVSFELSGPGADMLVGDGFAGLACVKPLAR
jgi:type VI secretion system protein ImpL